MEARAKQNGKNESPADDGKNGEGTVTVEDADDADTTAAACRDFLSRFNRDVVQAIALLIEHYWDWDQARDWMADQWEQRHPLPKRTEFGG